MAVPFRRTSKTVKRKRRTHFKLQCTWYGRMPKLWWNETFTSRL